MSKSFETKRKFFSKILIFLSSLILSQIKLLESITRPGNADHQQLMLDPW